MGQKRINELPNTANTITRANSYIAVDGFESGTYTTTRTPLSDIVKSVNSVSPGTNGNVDLSSIFSGYQTISPVDNKMYVLYNGALLEMPASPPASNSIEIAVTPILNGTVNTLLYNNNNTVDEITNFTYDNITGELKFENTNADHVFHIYDSYVGIGADNSNWAAYIGYANDSVYGKFVGITSSTGYMVIRENSGLKISNDKGIGIEAAEHIVIKSNTSGIGGSMTLNSNDGPINITAGSSNLILNAGDINAAYVELSDSYIDIQKQNSGMLNITHTGVDNINIRHTGTGSVNIISNNKGEINIESDNDDINISSYNNGEIRLQSDSGNVYMTSNDGDIFIHSSNGRLFINNGVNDLDYVFSTGASHTVDDLIAALHSVGIFKQS
jgi:hypothetical protein